MRLDALRYLAVAAMLAWFMGTPVAQAQDTTPTGSPPPVVPQPQPGSEEALYREQLFQRLSAAAATGHLEVRYNLGMFLHSGIGTPRDRAAAFRVFQEAADAGHPLAAYQVGGYFSGQYPGVVPPDAEQSMKYRMLAAEAGYDLAQLEVGLLWARRGDMAQAVAWWEKASRQGEMTSTRFLADVLSREGSQDRVLGYAMLLLLKASLPTDVPKTVQDRITALESVLGVDDVGEAARRLQGWRTGPSLLSAQARRGASAVPALLASLGR